MELKIPPPVVAILMGTFMSLLSDAVSIHVVLDNKLYISLAIAALGLLVDFSALWLFVKAKTTVNPIKPNRSSALVTAGIYRFTRNPMYVGNFIFLSAWLVWLGSPLSAIFLVTYVLYMNRYQISAEERILREKFGEPYDVFCGKVRRWV